MYIHVHICQSMIVDTATYCNGYITPVVTYLKYLVLCGTCALQHLKYLPSLPHRNQGLILAVPSQLPPTTQPSALTLL